jgi:hypothetical protein
LAKIGLPSTAVESAVLHSIVAALPERSSSICAAQVAAINKVQRYLDWTEINFYRLVAGKPD